MKGSQFAEKVAAGQGQAGRVSWAALEPRTQAQCVRYNRAVMSLGIG